MVFISLMREDLPSLESDGVNVRINGKAVVVKKEGQYLCYDNERRKILQINRSDYRNDRSVFLFICSS